MDHLSPEGEEENHGEERGQRCDHGPAQRAVDALPIALRAELDGTKWVPPSTERGWSPAKV